MIQQFTKKYLRMATKQSIQAITTIYTFLFQGRVLESIELLKQHSKTIGKEYISDELSKAEFTYRNILQHSFSGINDPERDKILISLIRDLIEIADEVKELISEEMTDNPVYLLKRQLLKSRNHDQELIRQLLEQQYDGFHIQGLLDDIPLESYHEESADTRNDNVKRIFNYIWFTDKFADTEIKRLLESCKSENLEWYEKSLIVSALTMSLLRYFQVSKFEALMEIVHIRQYKVWERAMVGLVLAFYIHNSRFYLYPALKEKLYKLSFEADILKHTEAIINQLTRSKDTENVRRKWETDILPEVMKMQPRIEEKLNLDSIVDESLDEDKNPDWEQFFEDAPDLLDKLQKMTEMQLEGVDVFMGAFSQLKQFPFFQEHYNWFVPFYSQHPAVRQLSESLPGSLGRFLDTLENTRFICNSDKYSFCFNMIFIPEQQKAMMANMMGEELKNYEVIEKDESIIDSFSQSRGVFIQYIQDLYRFFKLHPWKGWLKDPFDKNLDVYHTAFFDCLGFSERDILRMASYYFEKSYYQDASNLFKILLKNDAQAVELLEKNGYCYVKLQDYAHALDYLLKADFYGTASKWRYKQMAICYKNLGMWEKALSIYEQMEKLEPDDLSVQAQIGQCLVHLEKFDQALQYYFKLEVLSPENEKVRRPLAWCSFLMGKYDTASDYYQRLIQTEKPNAYDLMNYAHVMLCMGKKKEAADSYIKGMHVWGDMKEFFKSYREDRKHLLNAGVPETEIDLMADFIRMALL